MLLPGSKVIQQGSGTVADSRICVRPLFKVLELGDRKVGTSGQH